MQTFLATRAGAPTGRVDRFVLVIGVLVVILTEFGNDLFVEAGDKGDDIILHKGKIIMRGGKGKGKFQGPYNADIERLSKKLLLHQKVLPHNHVF